MGAQGRVRKAQIQTTNSRIANFRSNFIELDSLGALLKFSSQFCPRLFEVTLQLFNHRDSE